MQARSALIYPDTIPLLDWCMLVIGLWLAVSATLKFRFFFHVTFNSQGHIVMGSLRVEEPVHTSWSIFCAVNHRVSASDCQLSNMKHPGRDSNQRPQRLSVFVHLTFDSCLKATLN